MKKNNLMIGGHWKPKDKVIFISLIFLVVIFSLTLSTIFLIDEITGPQFGRGLRDDIFGCTDVSACNYDIGANVNDGSCNYWLYMGDLNEDGNHNILDIVGIVSIILDNGPYDAYEPNVDMDGNGIINILDVVSLINGLVAEESIIWDYYYSSPDLSDFSPFIGEDDVHLGPYLSWKSEEGIIFNVSFGNYTDDEGNPPLVEINQESKTFIPPVLLDENSIYYWKIDAKDSHCGVNSSPVLFFATTEEGGDGSNLTTGEVDVTVTGSFEYEYNVENGTFYDSYSFGPIERGQAMNTSEIGEGRGIEMVNIGTVAVNIIISYADSLLDDSNSLWKYYAKCLAINESSGEIQEYISGEDGCVGNYLETNSVILTPEFQNVATCLKYTSLENDYKPGISLGQEIYVSYSELLGVKNGLLNIYVGEADEEIYCNENPYDEETVNP